MVSRHNPTSSPEGRVRTSAGQGTEEKKNDVTNVTVSVQQRDLAREHAKKTDVDIVTATVQQEELAPEHAAKEDDDATTSHPPSDICRFAYCCGCHLRLLTPDTESFYTACERCGDLTCGSLTGNQCILFWAMPLLLAHG